MGTAFYKLVKENIAMFFSKKKYKVKDKVFINNEFKWQTITNDILEYINDGYIVISVAHFEKSMDIYKTFLNSKSMKFETIQTNWKYSELDLKKIIDLGKRAIIHLDKNTEINQFLTKNPKQLKLLIIMIERYPIHKEDKIIYSFANTLTCKTEIFWYTSLEEPFMKVFGGDRIISLMEMLNIEDDCIEHSSITSAIKGAQNKIKRISIGDQKVISVDEWFQYNCPTAFDKFKTKK